MALIELLCCQRRGCLEVLVGLDRLQAAVLVPEEAGKGLTYLAADRLIGLIVGRALEEVLAKAASDTLNRRATQPLVFVAFDHSTRHKIRVLGRVLQPVRDLVPGRTFADRTSTPVAIDQHIELSTNRRAQAAPAILHNSLRPCIYHPVDTKDGAAHRPAQPNRTSVAKDQAHEAWARGVQDFLDSIYG